MEEFILRKAMVRDVKSIHGLLMKEAATGEGIVLPRSFNELYNRLRDFYVVEDGATRKVVACCALAITWNDIAEVRSLVVSQPLRQKGWGRRLVEACVSEALTFGLYKVFTLTAKPDFFKKLGFVLVDQATLPQKVWADCLNCPKYPDQCDEVAMQLTF
ncbi:N-acetyltransferase [Desulfoplanes sp.]